MPARSLAVIVVGLSLLATSCSGAQERPVTGQPTTVPGGPPDGTSATSNAPIATSPVPTLPVGAAVCDGYTDITEVGKLNGDDLREISGIAASRRHPGVIWAHNDSGGGPRLYGLSENGQLMATWVLDGAGALDWEDMAAGPGPEPGVSYLYIGDIGDNLSFRPNITVYRFPEPALEFDGAITSYERLTLAYPEPGHNAEALAVDPATGDLFVVTKDRGGPEIVFMASAAELLGQSTTILREVARLELGGRSEVTAADFSPTGERFALRGYNRLWMWPRSSADMGVALQAEPCRAASPDEIQGESLAFAADGLSMLTVSEGTGAPIHRVQTAP